MADFSTLIASIEATIKQNGVQAITGQVLQDELLAMVAAINQLKQDTLEGYAFYGEALPNGATRVVTQNTFFLAGAGSYTINGNAITISDSGISVIVYDCVNDEISTYQLFAYDANPTNGSGNAVTSGGVHNALAGKQALVPAATEGNLAEFDNAGQVRDAGVATSDLATKAGHYPDLFAGFAGNLVDTRSAGTRQGPFAFRQSGGDGVDYMVRIKGRTEAWNQLVGPSDTQVTIPSGHLYYAIINGTASVGTSDGTPIAVTGGTDIVVDLTLEGLGLTTADQFRALHPLPYYNYNAGVLKNNAATGLETRGFNQWDEEWEVGQYNASTGEKQATNDRIRSTNKFPIFPSTTYYCKCNYAVTFLFYDANGTYLSWGIVNANSTITTPAGAALAAFYCSTSYGTTYNHDICINRSDASRNGEYEPYWKRKIVLGLDNLPCHDENNNAVVVNGLDGVGTAQDEVVVENGWGTKINKKMEEVDLGSLAWVLAKDSLYRINLSTVISKPETNWNAGNIICAKYVTNSRNGMPDKTIAVSADGNVFVKDSAFSGYTGAQVAAALTGVKLRYELATSKVLTLDNPIPALIEVDNLGTEKRLPEDTADNPQAPFECDSNYSVSTANLVRKLSE